LPVVPPQVKRIVVIGDTGCRLEGRAVQDCRSPAAWPFAAIAAHAAAHRPDLVIHLGDYYYRVSGCPAGRAGCAGSPHGDNWASWKADFFDPAAPLLGAAPWIVVRGNHELCRRGGRGWFRLLDPRPARGDCSEHTDPYRLSIGGLDLLVFDSADADDFLAPPDKVAAYAAQLAHAPYLTGNEITIADIGLYPIYAGRKALIDGAGLKNVAAWGERVGARPAVQKGMKLES